MADTMYLLDFRRGIVERIDDALSPRGLAGPAIPTVAPQPDDQPEYVLASIGTPPQRDAE